MESLCTAEYESLREEILRNQDRDHQILLLGIGATGGILSFAFLNDNPLATSVVPPLLWALGNRSRAIHMYTLRIASYLMHAYERDPNNRVRWESSLDRFRRLESTRVLDRHHARSRQTIFYGLIAASILAAVVISLSSAASPTFAWSVLPVIAVAVSAVVADALHQQRNTSAELLPIFLRGWELAMQTERAMGDSDTESASSPPTTG